MKPQWAPSVMVLDASVLVKLFFREEHSEVAEHCLRRADALLAPDLIWAECAQVIWKRHRCNGLSQENAAAILAELLRVPLRVYASAELIRQAMDLAIHFDRTVYDCLYLALAVETASTVLTADRKLANALADTPLAASVKWLGDC